VFVTHSNASTPANAAAAITALMTLSITALRSLHANCPENGDHECYEERHVLSSLTTLLAVRAPTL
jgi:hypothetical protein